MGFEVYLQCFDSGEPAGLPRATVRALFPIVEAESQADYWAVRYDALNYCHIHVTPHVGDSSRVEVLSVVRPCRDMRLWDALCALLVLGHVVFYFPGDSPPLVGSATTIDHVPTDMIESMGRPLVVGSGHELVSAIEQA